jgi:hypothetical protein
LTKRIGFCYEKFNRYYRIDDYKNAPLETGSTLRSGAYKLKRRKTIIRISWPDRLLYSEGEDFKGRVPHIKPKELMTKSKQHQIGFHGLKH